VSGCPTPGCVRAERHPGERHYAGGGKYFGRAYPAKLITMPADMWERLDEIAERWGTSRSGTVARLVREAELPRRRA
jgi:hypothetical protein